MKNLKYTIFIIILIILMLIVFLYWYKYKNLQKINNWYSKWYINTELNDSKWPNF